MKKIIRDSRETPTLVAHRGYMTRYPENTWPGLKAALDAGTCWLEFDVQMCAGGEFILMHDSDLARTADLHRSVFDIAAKELKTFSVHEPARFHNRFHPQHIDTLDEIFVKLANYPQARAMVEVKEESLAHWGVDNVMQRLIDKLIPYSGHCILISFSLDALRYAQDNSDIRLGLILKRYDSQGKAAATALNPKFLICNHKKLPLGQRPWPGPWEWVLYEINSPEEAMTWAELGVRYIETGDIGAMMQDGLLMTKACKHGV